MDASLTVKHTPTNIPIKSVANGDRVTVGNIVGKVVGVTQVTDELTTLIVTLPSTARITVSRA